MNDDLKAHLLARRSQLLGQMMPLQASLNEVESLLRLMGGDQPQRPTVKATSNGETVATALRRVLSSAGPSGLTPKEAEVVFARQGIPEGHRGISARLCSLRARGEVVSIDGRFIMKSEHAATSPEQQP